MLFFSLQLTADQLQDVIGVMAGATVAVSVAISVRLGVQWHIGRRQDDIHKSDLTPRI